MKKKFYIGKVLLSGLILLLCAGLTYAADRYVNINTGTDDLNPGRGDTSGDPWKTVGFAVTNATAGDTIYVAAGLYQITSRINVTKSLTLLGPKNNIDPRPINKTTRVPGDILTEAILDGGDGATTITTIMRINASNVEVNGFHFRDGSGDMVDSSGGPFDSVAVRYNILTHATGDEGMQIRNSKNSVSEYNYIKDTFGDGINFSDGTTSGVIQFNEIVNCHSENGAIYVYNPLPQTDSNIIIRGNLINTTDAEGINFGNKGGGDNTKLGGKIIGNRILNTGDDAIELNMSYTVVSDNEIAGCHAKNGGIQIRGYSPGVGYITITKNNMHDNAFVNAGGITPNPGCITVGAPTNTATVAINYNHIYNSTPYGIQNLTSVVVNAENNWWGSHTGPDDDDNVINGIGAKISTKVDASPYNSLPTYLNDRDGDGIENFIEIAVTHTDPDLKDTDNDGVEDGVEVTLGTDPNSNLSIPSTPPGTGDSDNDMFKDFYEVACGTNPNDDKSFPVLGNANNFAGSDNVDAVIIFNLFLKNIDFPQFPYYHRMDVNRDGIIDHLDGLLMLNAFLGNVTIP